MGHKATDPHSLKKEQDGWAAKKERFLNPFLLKKRVFLLKEFKMFVNKKNRILHIIRRTSAVCVLVMTFLSSNVQAGVDVLNATLIRATPFDYKLSLAGFFNLSVPNHPINTILPAESIDSLFNKARSFRYAEDRTGDYWQSPEETDRKHSGDCEDKAVWLYAQLKYNGYSDVRLVIGKYRSFDRKYHVWVLCTDASGASYLLDPAAQKRVCAVGHFSPGFYQPVYSFDGQNRYLYKAS